MVVPLVKVERYSEIVKLKQRLYDELSSRPLINPIDVDLKDILEKDSRIRKRVCKTFKFLKVNFKKVHGRTYVIIKEQTHRGKQFGRKGNEYIASNNFHLISRDSPHTACYGAFYLPFGLYVRGPYIRFDNITCQIVDTAITKEFWMKACKQAVKEYNQTFRGI